MAKTYELDLADYWRIIKRRKLVILIVFVTVTSAIWIHTSRIPPTYEASAAVKIERTQVRTGVDVTMEGAYEVSDFIDAQLEIIGSEGVAYEAAIHAGVIKEEMTEEEKGQIASRFQGVNGARRGSTNIVDIMTSSNDPKETALIVNMVSKGYQTWSLKNHNEQARQVREYVKKLLDETESKLKAKGEELRIFKEKVPIGAALGSFQTQLVDMELKLSNLLEKYTPQHPEVIELEAQIGALKSKLAKFPTLELEYGHLTKEFDSFNSSFGLLKQKYEDAKISEAQTVSGVTIIDQATVPNTPVSPNVQKNVTVGMVIAVILGVLLAFVKENVDTSISTIEEVEDFLQVPILGVIPEMVQLAAPSKKWEWREWLKFLPLKAFQRSGGSDTTTIEDVRKLVMLSGVEHQFSSLEAYKTLRTNVNFAVSNKKGVILEVTSAGAREGKSLTALNLSLSLAQNEQKVCLISADLRRETISRLLGVKKEPGLVEILTKDLKWQDVVRKTTDFLVGELSPDRILQTMGIDSFCLLTSGKLPPNPSELLSLEGMNTLLTELRQQFDFIIVDTPPVLPVSDASVLAPKVDGVILVYQVGRTARGALKRAKTQIASTGANVLGIVLNNIKAAEMKMAPTYYYYREYYGPEEQLIRERHSRHGGPKSWWQRLFSKAA